MKLTLLFASLAVSSPLMGALANICISFPDAGSYVVQNPMDKSGTTMPISNELTVTKAREWVYNQAKPDDYFRNFFYLESNRKLYDGIWKAIDTFSQAALKNRQIQRVNKVFGKKSKLDAVAEAIVFGSALFAGMSSISVAVVRKLHDNLKSVLKDKWADQITQSDFKKFQDYMFDTYNQVVTKCKEEKFREAQEAQTACDIAIRTGDLSGASSCINPAAISGPGF